VVIFLYAIVLAAAFAMVWVVHSVVVHLYIAVCIRAAPSVVCSMPGVPCIVVARGVTGSVVLLGLGICEAKGHEK